MGETVSDSVLRNVTGAKLRAIHRSERRKGRMGISLRGWARSIAGRPDETLPPLAWLAHEARAWLARKGARL